MDRRELLKWLVATGGTAAFNRLSIADLESLGRDMHNLSQSQLQRALAPHAARTVAVAAELIIPRTDTPGATDAAVTPFIDRMLSEWYAPADRDRFLAGIATLDERSRAQGNRLFVESAQSAQVALLSAIDMEVAALRRAQGAAANDHWFAMLKYLTVWGYCTSERGMRDTLRTYPPPMRLDPCAPVEIRRNTRVPSRPSTELQ